MQTANGFLVVIPTRNRAQLARAAIESVLNEDIREVAVLVSDNSTNATDSATLRTICDLYSKNQVSYIRPDHPLRMAPHWDWAMQEAVKHPKTNHFLYLTDRMVFKRGALKRIVQLAKRYPQQVMTYKHDALKDNEYPITVYQHAWSNRVYEISSASALRSCSRLQWDECLPRMLNSVVPRFVLERFRDRFGNYFSSFAPDFNFCFRYLLLFDSFIFVDRALGVHYALSKSNGVSQQFGGTVNKDNVDYLNNPSGTFSLQGTLMPEVTTVGNTIIYEYIQLQTATGSSRFPEIDRDKYLAFIGREIADIQDPERREKWENLIRAHTGGEAARAERVEEVTQKRRMSKLIRVCARRLAETALNMRPELVLTAMPSRFREKLAANKWRFNDSQKALFCALHFERATEFPAFHLAHSEDSCLEWSVLPD